MIKIKIAGLCIWLILINFFVTVRNFSNKLLDMF